MPDGIAGHRGYPATARRRDDEDDGSGLSGAGGDRSSLLADSVAVPPRLHPGITQEVAPNDSAPLCAGGARAWSRPSAGFPSRRGGRDWLAPARVSTHSRRRLVHFNVTEHPTAEWTAR
jgi:hypothetical protein